jgi:hypothetical protein
VHDNPIGTYLEHIPDQIIPYSNSRFYQVIYTITRNQVGKLRFIAVVKLQPKIENLRAIGMFGAFDVLITLSPSRLLFTTFGRKLTT